MNHEWWSDSLNEFTTFLMKITENVNEVSKLLDFRMSSLANIFERSLSNCHQQQYHRGSLLTFYIFS